jgi:hypothetical protein
MSEQTIDQAVAEMVAEEEASSAPVDAETVEESSATTDENVSEEETPGDDVDGVDEGSEEDETDEAEAEAVEAPQWWDAEDKEVFATLTPEQQAAVAKNEAKREAVVSKSKQEAAEIRKAAETKVQELTSLAEEISQALPKAQQAFQSRWEGMTPEMWLELSNADPQTAFQLKIQYDAEMAELESVRVSQEKASKVSLDAHYATQAAKLREIAPILASDPAVLKATGEHIVKSGIAPEAIASATAEELLMAYESMMWRQSQAKAKTLASAPKNVTTPPAKTVKPVAAVQPGNVQSREITQLRNRVQQTHSLDDEVALMLAEERAGKRASR